MRTRVKLILIIAIIVIITAVCGALFYFSGQKKSPEYSLDLINNAIKMHDYTTFSQHIDLDEFYAAAFDDVIAPTLNQQGNANMNEFLISIMDTVKNSFVRSMSEQTKSYVESGSLETTSRLPESILAKKFIELIDFRYASFKKITKTTIEGNIAYVDLLIHQTQLNEDFALQLKMRKLDDSTWAITRINNIQDFLANVAKHKNAKLEELNAPLAKQISTQALLTNEHHALNTASRSGLTSSAFTYQATAEFLTDKQINSLRGQMDVYNKNNEKIYSQKFVTNGPFPAHSKQEIKLSWPLNPYIPNNKLLIDTSDFSLKVKGTIIGITFTDGSTVELLENLPD